MSFKTDITDFLKKLEKVKDEVTSKETLKPLAEETVEDIKTRVRAGYGVKKNKGSRSRLDKLADSTKKSRKNHKKQGKLSSDTKPSKSNLTDTGEMIDSLTADVKDDMIAITLDGSRNNEVAGYVSKDRPFLHLSKSEFKRLVERLQKVLGKLIQ